MPTLTIRNRVFPGGEEIPGGMVIQDITGNYSLHAWPTISIESSPGVFMLYHFFMWNTNGETMAQSIYRNINMTEDKFANAWYFSLAEFQPPPSTIQTYVYHVDTDQVYPDLTCIEDTAPDSAWAGGQSTVASTAIDYLDSEAIWVHAKQLEIPFVNSHFVIPWRLAFGTVGDGYQFSQGQFVCNMAIAVYKDNAMDPNPNIASGMDLDEFYLKARKIKSIIKSLSLPGHQDWNAFLQAIKEMEIIKRKERDELSDFLADADEKNKAELNKMQAKVGRSIKRLESASVLLRKAIDTLEDKM
ncbi:hypothetical protein [Flavihumibacter solisilvae]|uniref:Uncharacterized protein n=1 Tax=Flavihumibacter solisilvae TaxID=1349421 RepID=A0A0C1KZI4_9BACT|nr:hypothetical protein [Flavihumibacter solisilvae]KIC92701.1 hypothetical protein OI18_21525 [Flavihumibacter solisilvae]